MNMLLVSIFTGVLIIAGGLAIGWLLRVGKRLSTPIESTFKMFRLGGIDDNKEEEDNWVHVALRKFALEHGFQDLPDDWIRELLTSKQQAVLKSIEQKGIPKIQGDDEQLIPTEPSVDSAWIYKGRDIENVFSESINSLPR